MNVDYIDHMGDDLTVVNSARVSFNKESEYESVIVEKMSGQRVEKQLTESDVRLIKYLASHGHWTPFSHPQITVRVKAPIFVARQLYKHKVGFTENEVSRRYVNDAPSYFVPSSWRTAPTNGAKQGSGDGVVTKLTMRNDVESWPGEPTNEYYNYLECATSLYNSMLEAGIAPEQARMILPQSMYTEWYWTASLAAFARMCKQRMDPHAQAETREIALKIDAIIAPLFPESWEALTT